MIKSLLSVIISFCFSCDKVITDTPEHINPLEKAGDSIYVITVNLQRMVSTIDDMQKNVISDFTFVLDGVGNSSCSVYSYRSDGPYKVEYVGPVNLLIVDSPAVAHNSGSYSYIINPAVLGRRYFRIREGNATLKSLYISMNAKFVAGALLDSSISKPFGEWVNRHIQKGNRFSFIDYWKR